MPDIRNKPRVFLSHSKKDIEFIHRIEADLRKCQIDPWLDEIDIRHGQPWLDAIFESGIPTCDCILVYLTEASLQSPMVKKELDAGIITKLKDSRVALLPYVADSALRAQLRADIQTVQVPEWNEKNYAEMLPRVVAEVWHSFMDRGVAAAVNDEKVKRLEAEAHLSQLQSASTTAFTTNEEADFAFIWNALDKWVPVHVTVKSDPTMAPGVRAMEVHLGSLVLDVERRYDAWVDEAAFDAQISQAVFRSLHKLDSSPLCKVTALSAYNLRWTASDRVHASFNGFAMLADILLMFSLVEKKPYETTDSELRRIQIALFEKQQYRLVFTSKFARLRYWLTYHGNLPATLRLRRATRSRRKSSASSRGVALKGGA